MGRIHNNGVLFVASVAAQINVFFLYYFPQTVKND